MSVGANRQFADAVLRLSPLQATLVLQAYEALLTDFLTLAETRPMLALNEN